MTIGGLSADNPAGRMHPMSGDERILAIETTGRAGSVCVARGGDILARADLPTHTRHAGGLHAAIDRLVRAQGWSPDALDEVHVSAGPGSFTGARIGITVARTLGWATGARVVRVPTVDVVARNALLIPEPPHFVAVILDAKRAQVFTALFARAAADRYEKILDATMTDPFAFLTKTAIEQATQYQDARVQPPLPCGERSAEGRPEPQPDLATRSTSSGERTSVPTPSIAVLGEGIDYHRDAIARANAVILPRELWAARAEGVLAVGRTMAAAGQYCAVGDCLPIYVRIPEPEEKWRERHAAARPPA